MLVLLKKQIYIYNVIFAKKLEASLTEHAYCYSLGWCIKREENMIYEWPQFVGIGRLLISKNGKLIGFEGSFPSVDWVKIFELQIRGLEEYWYLEVEFKEEYITKLKAALNCSTPQLLAMVDENSKIVFDEKKDQWGHSPELFQIEEDLNKSGIKCQRETRIRSKYHVL